MITRKDCLLVSIIGFFFGLLLLPVLNNIKLPFVEITFSNAFLIVVGFVIFANFALWLISLLSRLFPVLLQIAKFVAVGGLNTLLDLGILNTLIFLSGIAAGWWYSIFKGISFIVAVINSYFWNKYWTFGASGTASIKEFSQFFVVSLIGFGINIGLASFVVNVMGSPEGISPERWANIGAISATIASLIWNFVGYKFIVFKK
jgi:putative flippase GtrA